MVALDIKNSKPRLLSVQKHLTKRKVVSGEQFTLSH